MAVIFQQTDLKLNRNIKMINSRASIQSPKYRQNYYKPISSPTTQWQENKKENNYRIIPSNLPYPTMLSPTNNHSKPTCHTYTRNNTHHNINSNLLTNISLDQMKLSKMNQLPLINSNRYNLPPPIPTNQSPLSLEKDNKQMSSSRYSSELNQLRKQLCSLKGNLHKLQNQQHGNDHTQKSQLNFLKKDLNIKYINQSERYSQQFNTFNDNSKNRDKSITTYNTKQNNQKNIQYGDKIDLILKKISELEITFQKNSYLKEDVYFVKKHHQIEKIDSIEQLNQPISTSLLDKINQKTIQLKRIQINHLNSFIGINRPQESIISSLMNQNIPEQWKVFQTQLDTLLYKFQEILKKQETKKSQVKINKKNSVKWQENHQNFNEIKKITQQNKLKEQQNEVLKLQYLKLKNKLIGLQQQHQVLQSELSQYKCLKRQYVYEIERLQKLLENQDEKIKTMDNIKQKKQDIQMQFHRILNQMNEQMQRKQQIIDNLRQQVHRLNSNKIKSQIEQVKQDGNRYENSIKKEKHIRYKIQTIHQNILPSHNNCISINTDLVLQLAKLIDVHCSQSNQAAIMNQIVNKFKREKYVEIYLSYLQIAKFFQVDLHTANHYELIVDIVRKNQNNFKTLGLKYQKLSKQHEKKQTQIQMLSFQLQNQKYKLKQSEKKYFFLSQQNQNGGSTINNSQIPQLDVQNQLLFLNSRTWDLTFNDSRINKTNKQNKK